MGFNEDMIARGGEEIKRITFIGLWVNAGLLVIKLAAGLLLNSIALVADAFHTLSDIVTDIVVILGSYFGSRPADPGHPFGHGKFETLSALILVVVLMIVGIGIMINAGFALRESDLPPPSAAALLIALVAIVSKEIVYQVTVKVAKRLASAALYANAWHHRSDALSSVVVFIGVGLSVFGVEFGDSLAGLIVGLMVFIVGAKLALNTLSELTETSVAREIRETIKEVLKNHDEVRNWHQLRTRKVGRELFIDVHILVSEELSVAQGHIIAENVEAAVRRTLKRPANILTHIEPDFPEERRTSGADE